MGKKKEKEIAHARMVWEREQIQAATAMERLVVAASTLEQYSEELTDEQFNDALAHVEGRKKDIEAFLMAARDKYVRKMGELNLDVLMEEANA